MISAPIQKNIHVLLSAGMLLGLMPVNIQASTGTKIVLDSKILAMFDGIPFALDGDAFDNMLHVRKAIHNLLQKNLYTYKNTRCTVNELVQAESAEGLTPELTAILAIVKEELVGIAEPFMNQARGTKHFLLPIMTDWTKKRTRETTLLLKWHHEEEGKELEMFRQDIVSFTTLKSFCDDLILFMEDLMYNCPKGFNQLLKKKRASKTEL